MENLTYIGLSRQVSLWKQMNTTANNMANMSTPGYKAQKVTFEEFINTKAKSEIDNRISQVRSDLNFMDLSQGSLKNTHAPLDVAITGEGYFVIETPSGQKYTRAGSFQISQNSQLVTSSGYKVMGDGGSPLEIAPDALDIVIAADGTISDRNGEIGKLKIVKFDEKETLIPVGDNLFHSGNAKEEIVTTPQIEQGMLEMSNVEPVREMNNMIKLQRMFEATTNMLRSDHDRQRNTIKVLTEA